MGKNIGNISNLDLFTYEDVLNEINSWAKNQLVLKNINFNNSGKIPFFVQYLNYLSKLISSKPRRVNKARNFEVNPENNDGFIELVKAFESGLDINPYLSKGILNAKTIDGMLDNFGVKHFHLGKKLKDKFFKRTGEIALAIVTNDEVFFIVSKQHGKGHGDIWYEKDVIEIVHEERPDLIEHCKVSMFEKLSNNISDTNDIKKLRNANLNTAITLDDGISYMPFNLGQSLAGFSVMFSVTMINVAKDIHSLISATIQEQINIGFQIKNCEISQLNFLADGKPKFIELKLSDGKSDKYLEFDKEQT
ncbi:hypothetical protein [Psychrobacter sp. AOP7-D1-21]|uniref:hypothetical protein n=1 Tax=Psychrobacter sp. AOP7-D1-21 TaxID=3457636 RepID=UPI003FBA526C